MGKLHTDLALRGLGLADDRFSFDKLNPRDGSATGSAYSEQGPRPGTARADDPRSTLIAEVQNGQGEDLEIYVARSGDVGIGSSAELLFREKDEEGTGDPLDGWKAYARPSFLHLYGTAKDPAAAISSFDAVVLPGNQRAVMVTEEPSSLKSSRYFGTAEWGAGGDVTSIATGGPIAVTALPSGRLYAVSVSSTDPHAWYSDDEGATWSLYAENVVAVPGTPARARLAVVDDVVVLLTEDGGAPFTFRQWVSTDLGVSFQEVASAGIGQSGELHVSPSGELLLVYRNSTTIQLTIRRVGSPFDSLFTSSALVGPLGSFADLVYSAMEPDGVLWALVQLTGTQEWEVLRSVDTGDSWETMGTQVLTLPQSGPRAPAGKLLAVDGSLLWLTQFRDDGAATDLEPVQMLVLGGWSTVGVHPDAGWGDYVSGLITDDQRDTYLPIELPLAPWVDAGAGSAAIVAPGVLEISTAGQRREFSRSLPGSANPGYFFGIFQVEHLSGGSFADVEAGFSVGVSDGTDDYRVELRLSEEAGGFGQETRFRLVDQYSGSVLAEVTPTPDALNQKLEFLVRLDGVNGTADVQWRFARAYDNWKTLHSGTLTPKIVPTVGGSLEWGSPDTGTAVTRWSLVAYKWGEDFSFREFLAYDVEDKRGRSFGGVGFPLGGIEGELPLQRDLSDRTVFLALRGGPARRAETQQIPASYDFGIENLFAEVSPSPSSTWRSRDLSDAELAWTFETKSLPGDSWIFGLYVENPTFRRVEVEFDTSPGGSGTWLKVGELDLAEGFLGLEYETDGTDLVRPNKATTPDSDRYIHRNELAGGIVVVGAVGHRIKSNTSGRWTQGDTVDPLLRTVEAGPGGAGTCDVVAPRGMFFLHLQGGIASVVSGVRLRILGSDVQIVGEDYLEAGIVRPVFLVPFGQQPSRGWSQEMVPNTSETEFRSGTIRKRKEGRPRRRWTWSWPDGVKLDRIRQETDPDYLGVSGRPPAIVKEDVWTLLWGLLEETDGTEKPVVACNWIPKVLGMGSTVTDRTLFLLGVLDGSGRFDHVLGDEGVDEFGRLSPIAVRELV